MNTTKQAKKRTYLSGRCEDCGQRTRVTEIAFWLNGLRYRVCRACIKPYRNRINKP